MQLLVSSRPKGLSLPDKLILACAALIAVAVASFATPALAQATWRMVTEYPQSNISGTGLATFARLVSARTSGAVSVTIAFDNEAKITSGDMPRAAKEGVISGGDAFAGALTHLDAVFGLPTLPFVVQSADVARTVNKRARPLYEQALRTQGLKLLYLTIWPATGLWSEQPLLVHDELTHLKLRTYDDSSTAVMRAAGASAEFLPLNEAIKGLKEHRLNAFLTSGDGGAGRKLWDYLPHFTAINYAMPVSLAFVRTEDFEALPDALKGEVEAAAAKTEQSQFDLLANRSSENYARMRANGVSIAEPAPPALIATLRQAATAPIAAWKARNSTVAVEIVEWAMKQ
ncbi:TRAP transporter substrate-binding protein [Bradyrhizobium sp. STM 3562]|uniref:TRAP transporter substrate-binding protein n=1 Tax=Bradyrhizobium sp. STM 3562 TaxID=578924 RepID=UPI00388F7102